MELVQRGIERPASSELSPMARAAGTVQTPNHRAALGRIGARKTSQGRDGPFIDPEATNAAQLGENGFVI